MIVHTGLAWTRCIVITHWPDTIKLSVMIVARPGARTTNARVAFIKLRQIIGTLGGSIIEGCSFDRQESFSFSPITTRNRREVVAEILDTALCRDLTWHDSCLDASRVEGKWRTSLRSGFLDLRRGSNGIFPFTLLFMSYYFIFICSTEPNLFFFFSIPWNEVLKICIHVLFLNRCWVRIYMINERFSISDSNRRRAKEGKERSGWGVEDLRDVFD